MVFKLNKKNSNNSNRLSENVVLLTFDDNYLNQTLNLIMSVHKYNKDVDFICLCPSLLSDTIKKLFGAADEIKRRIVVYEYSIDYDFKRSWPNVCCYRIFSPWLIDEEVESVLYLDSDILCKGGISELFADKNMICMCNEIIGSTRIHTQKATTDIYCNSGVLKLNLREFRKK